MKATEAPIRPRTKEEKNQRWNEQPPFPPAVEGSNTQFPASALFPPPLPQTSLVLLLNSTDPRFGIECPLRIELLQRVPEKKGRLGGGGCCFGWNRRPIAALGPRGSTVPTPNCRWCPRAEGGIPCPPRPRRCWLAPRHRRASPSPMACGALSSCQRESHPG